MGTRISGIFCVVVLAIASLFLAIAPASAQKHLEVPEAVKSAVAAAGSLPRPNEVTIGVFVNDIHELDFRTNTYSVDLYVWFRWNNPEINPVKTMEFMNRYMPADHQRDVFLDTPDKMPDGSLYNIIRVQGRFSSKFMLERYPFDRQSLQVIFEDMVNFTEAQRYVLDKNPIAPNPDLTLPGYKVLMPTLKIMSHRYPTNFGDISHNGDETYSRVVLSIPISRPLLAISIKTFVPILLIIVSSILVLFVRPKVIEGRIGLAITALLTLVALQLTTEDALPDVNYLMLIDKAYLVSYALIIAVLSRVVATSWIGYAADGEKTEAQIVHNDRVWALFLVMLYVGICALMVAWTFSQYKN